MGVKRRLRENHKILCERVMGIAICGALALLSMGCAEDERERVAIRQPADASSSSATDRAPEPEESEDSVAWLEELGQTPAFDEQTRERLNRLAASPDPAVRLASVHALGRASEWHSPSKTLLNRLVEDDEFTVAAAAAEEVIRRYPITPPTDALVCEWVRSDDDEKRLAGLRIIPNVRAPDLKTWRVIEAIAVADEPTEVRVRALVALAEHRRRSAAAREAVLRGVESTDDHLRSMSLMTARWCEIFDEELMRVAETIAESDPDEDVRDEARAYLLSRDGDSEPVDEDF